MIFFSSIFNTYDIAELFNYSTDSYGDYYLFAIAMVIYHELSEYPW